MKKEGEKTINLTIKRDNGDVLCIILDNGIGINNTKKITHLSQKRKFFGAKATENRIRILHQNKGVEIETEDISSETTSGTKVSIRFPLN